MPDGAGPSSSSMDHDADHVAGTSTEREPRATDAAPNNDRGIMSYFIAGQNASAGRDANVGPLDS